MSKDLLLEIMETHDNINTFEEAQEHLVGQADFHRKAQKEEEMMKSIDDITHRERSYK